MGSVYPKKSLIAGKHPIIYRLSTCFNYPFDGAAFRLPIPTVIPMFVAELHLPLAASPGQVNLCPTTHRATLGIRREPQWWHREGRFLASDVLLWWEPSHFFNPISISISISLYWHIIHIWCIFTYWYELNIWINILIIQVWFYNHSYFSDVSWYWDRYALQVAAIRNERLEAVRNKHSLPWFTRGQHI